MAHTRPRREKKLVGYCARLGIAATLPCYDSVHKYRGKTVIFRKPLFPGYVFLQLVQPQRQRVYQSDYVANLLDVPDQETFAQQLGDILQALETDLEVFLAPQIIYQSDCVANLLEVASQDLFEEQLKVVLHALETDLEIRLAPEIKEGQRVRIMRGPLRGMEGWVEQRYGMSTVLLRLDFINQAAAVKLDADLLQPI